MFRIPRQEATPTRSSPSQEPGLDEVITEGNPEPITNPQTNNEHRNCAQQAKLQERDLIRVENAGALGTRGMWTGPSRASRTAATALPPGLRCENGNAWTCDMCCAFGGKPRVAQSASRMAAPRDPSVVHHRASPGSRTE